MIVQITFLEYLLCCRSYIPDDILDEILKVVERLGALETGEDEGAVVELCGV